MTEISLTVNGVARSGAVEPRTHLADFLRDGLNLTATHLRCEQGVCGACTILLDGVPARACITYAVACQGAEVTSLEGLAKDPVTQRLRAAFSREHGLQCGYCTPGMLVTARDIVTRLPDADEARIRQELAGNLCRCTGYAGIVRAIRAVLVEQAADPLPGPGLAASLGPAGARATAVTATAAVASVAPDAAQEAESFDDLGLGGRQPTLETILAVTVHRPAAEVWVALADYARVAPCLPGARLTAPPQDGRLAGEVSVKLGPIASRFSGTARVVRDEAGRRGTLHGAGRDRLSGTMARAEIAYAVHEAGPGATRIDLTVRAALAGPLAQFGRAQLVQDLLARLGAAFAERLEHLLDPDAAPGDHMLADTAPLRASSLVWQVLAARIGAFFRRLFKGHAKDKTP